MKCFRLYNPFQFHVTIKFPMPKATRAIFSNTRSHVTICSRRRCLDVLGTDAIGFFDAAIAEMDRGPFITESAMLWPRFDSIIETVPQSPRTDVMTLVLYDMSPHDRTVLCSIQVSILHDYRCLLRFWFFTGYLLAGIWTRWGVPRRCETGLGPFQSALKLRVTSLSLAGCSPLSTRGQYAWRNSG